LNDGSGKTIDRGFTVYEILPLKKLCRVNDKLEDREQNKKEEDRTKNTKEMVNRGMEKRG
jgi:hypothetical protein